MLSDDVRPAARGQHLLTVSIHSLTFDLKHKSIDYSPCFRVHQTLLIFIPLISQGSKNIFEQGGFK